MGAARPLPPSANIGPGGRRTRPGQLCAKRRRWALFDHLVGAGEECGRYLKPDPFGSLCVEDELKLGGLIKGNFGGVFTGLRPMAPVCALARLAPVFL